MARISPSDNLFASAFAKGVEFFRFSGSGISSFNDLVAKVRDHATVDGGMVTLNVRNCSQGWADSRAIYLRSA